MSVVHTNGEFVGKIQLKGFSKLSVSFIQIFISTSFAHNLTIHFDLDMKTHYWVQQSLQIVAVHLFLHVSRKEQNHL
jgi:hypothetical protein